MNYIFVYLTSYILVYSNIAIMTVIEFRNELNVVAVLCDEYSCADALAKLFQLGCKLTLSWFVFFIVYAICVFPLFVCLFKNDIQ